MTDDLSPDRGQVDPDTTVCVGDHDFTVWVDLDPNDPAAPGMAQVFLSAGVDHRDIAGALATVAGDLLAHAELLEIANGKGN